MKLSEVKRDWVFIKEIDTNDGEDEFHLKPAGQYMETKAVRRYIAIRKCMNMPLPSVFTDDTLEEEIDTSDTEAAILVSGVGESGPTRLMRELLQRGLHENAGIIVVETVGIPREDRLIELLKAKADERKEELYLEPCNRIEKRQKLPVNQSWKKDYTDIRKRDRKHNR